MNLGITSCWTIVDDSSSWAPAFNIYQACFSLLHGSHPYTFLCSDSRLIPVLLLPTISTFLLFSILLLLFFLGLRFGQSAVDSLELKLVSVGKEMPISRIVIAVPNTTVVLLD
jgi:hypothetical protein